MAIGVFAELAAELPPDHCAARHFANLWPLLLQGLGDRSPGVRRNAAYGTGVVAQHAPALAAPRYGEALAALGPVLSAPLPEAWARSLIQCWLRLRLDSPAWAALPSTQDRLDGERDEADGAAARLARLVAHIAANEVVAAGSTWVAAHAAKAGEVIQTVNRAARRRIDEIRGV